jgi:hypothetical protein
MKDNDAELKLLEKRRKGLRKELSTVSDKISKLVEIKFLPEYMKRYVDTYWVKQNRYDNENIWLVYTHVTAVKDVWDTGRDGINCLLICDTVQCTSLNEIHVHLGKEDYFNSLGKRITKSVYEKAKQALLDKLRSQL